MNETYGYRLRLDGDATAEELRSASPFPLEVEDDWICLRTDSSGLIGVLRFLHARGLEIVALERELLAAEERRSHED